MNHPINEGDMITARMVNAWVFCPRLFWLEEVGAEFKDNAHTLEGQRVHQRVDKPGGKIAPPEGDDGPDWHARSLWLSDESLGVSGQLDFVAEGADKAVFPVDTKKGASDGGKLWPPDQVQLTLQALLLRAAGYQVEQVAAWYYAERRRVTVPLTEEMVTAARVAVVNARASQRLTHPPPPLDDSPKCYGCSLNTVCLPDETRRLMAEAAHAEALTQEPRRVIPGRDDALPLYVQDYSARIGLSGSELVVTRRDPDDKDKTVTQKVGLGSLGQVNLVGNPQITTPALQELMRRSIPVSWLSSGGWFLGRVETSMTRHVEVRRAQYLAEKTEKALGFARSVITDKIANGRTFLRRNRRDASEVSDDILAALKRLIRDAEGATDAAQLLGFEGLAARLYWEGYQALMLRSGEAFQMQGRNRRPPRDPVNAMLSYGYGVLVKDCVQSVASVGLDPYMGLYHTPHHGRPSLALDLMEPFRPLVVDSVIFGLLQRGEVRAKDFVRAGQQVTMSQGVKRALLAAYERRMDEMVTHPTFGYRITYRQVLFVHARLITRYLLGEIQQLPSFRTR
jgi:CRISP-associated protein Cas1